MKNSKLSYHKLQWVILLSLINFSVIGQSPYVQGVTPPTYASPNAASLGKFGDIPVTYHTGTPEISIPIYTITQGSLSLPVSLSYHSSGIRVAEVSSWVGLGWSLNAGGMVTRTVHGGPDDSYWRNMPDHPVSDLRWGWYKDGGIPSQITQCQGQNQQSQIVSPSGATVTSGSPNSCASYYWDAGHGFIDLEPDLYTFNFNGRSGKFFFDQNKMIHMLPEDDYSIKPIINGSNGSFDGWIITTSDGVKYYFGTTAATEITKNDPSGSYTWKENLNAITWYLYKIVSANGEDEIDLTYTSEIYSFNNRGGQSFVLSLTNTYGSNVTTAPVTPSISYVEGKRLTQITTSSGNSTVTFSGLARYDVDVVSPNTAAQSLNNIQISTPSGCKTFALNSSYPALNGTGTCYGCPGVGTSNATRLFLNGVQETDCNGKVIPPYTFIYNSTPLPQRFSLGRDKWDYYNGHDDNQTEIPSDVYNPFNNNPLGNANRSVNDTYMQAGILTKINYPTGGSTSFSYEPNATSSQQVGGLRVTQIVNDDGKGNSTTKTFQYGPGTLHSGMPIYLQYPNNNSQKLNTADFGVIVSVSPGVAMWSTQGYHIGYGDVTETETGNGKTIYHYLNNSVIGHPDGSVYPMGELVAGFGTSDLSEKDIFRQGESTAFSQQSNNKLIDGNPVYIYARKVSNIACIGSSVCLSADNTNNLYTDYYIYTNRFRLHSTEVIQDGVTTHTDYEYGLTLNSPTAITLADSKGVVARTEWNYPQTTNSGAPAEMFDPANANFKNMITVPVEQREYRNGTIVSKAQNTFTATNGNVVLTQHKEFPTGGTDFIKSDYLYNSVQRLSQVNKSDGTKKSFLWGHNNSLMIAEATNADFAVSSPTYTYFGTTITANVSTCTNLAGSLVVNEQQNVSLAVSASLSGAPGLTATLTIKNSSGATVFGPKNYVNGSYSEMVNLPADTYTLCYQSSNYPTPYTGFSQFNITATTAPKYNIFYSSFEEDGTTDANPKTGVKVWTGTYSLAMPPQAGNYKVSYWSKQNVTGASWSYSEQTVTTNGSPSAVTLGQSGYVIDEVRMMPVGALMTTYAHLPGVGVKSITDPNNVSTSFTYDSFGRLLHVKDDKGKLLNTYKYNYKK